MGFEVESLHLMPMQLVLQPDLSGVPLQATLEAPVPQVEPGLLERPVKPDILCPRCYLLYNHG